MVLSAWYVPDGSLGASRGVETRPQLFNGSRKPQGQRRPGRSSLWERTSAGGAQGTGSQGSTQNQAPWEEGGEGGQEGGRAVGGQRGVLEGVLDEVAGA